MGLLSWLGDEWKKAKHGIEDVGENVGHFIGDTQHNVGGFVNDASKNVNNFTNDVNRNVGGAVNNANNFVQNQVEPTGQRMLFDTLKNVSTISKPISQGGANPFADIGTGVQKGIGTVGNGINDIAIKPTIDTFGKVEHTVATPIDGVVGLGMAAGDKLFNGGRNTQNILNATNQQMHQDLAHSFVPMDVANGTASPLKFAGDIAKTGTELAPYAVAPGAGALTAKLGTTVAEKVGGMVAPKVAQSFTTPLAGMVAGKLAGNIAGKVAGQAANTGVSAAISAPVFGALNAGEQGINAIMNGGQTGFDPGQANLAGLQAGAMTAAGDLGLKLAGKTVRASANGIRNSPGAKSAVIHNQLLESNPEYAGLSNQVTDLSRKVAQARAAGVHPSVLQPHVNAISDMASQMRGMRNTAGEGGFAKVPNPDNLFKKNAKNAYRVVDGQVEKAAVQPSGNIPPIQYSKAVHDYLKGKHPDEANKLYLDNFGHIRTLSNPNKIVSKDPRDIQYLQNNAQGKNMGRVSVKPIPEKNETYINTAHVVGGARRANKVSSAGSADPASRSYVVAGPSDKNLAALDNISTDNAVVGKSGPGNDTAGILPKSSKNVNSPNDRLKQIIAYNEQNGTKATPEMRAEFNTPHQLKVLDASEKRIVAKKVADKTYNKKEAEISQRMNDAKTVGQLRAAESEMRALRDESKKVNHLDNRTPTKPSEMLRKLEAKTSSGAQTSDGRGTASKGSRRSTESLTDVPQSKNRQTTRQNASHGATSRSVTASEQAQQGRKLVRPQDKTAKSQAQENQSMGQLSSRQKQVKTGTLVPTKSREPALSERSYGIDNTTDTVKRRGLVKSVKGSDEVSPEVKRKVNGKYNVRSTAKLAVEADRFAKMNLKDATTDVNDRLSVKRGRITDQDVADALAVAKRLDHTRQYDASQQIYDKLADHGTASGQTIQAFSLLKNRTPDGIKFQIIRNLKKSGVVLDSNDQARLTHLIDNIRKTKPDTESKARAIYNAMDFAARHTPTNRGDKLANFWRAGLLTAPKTTGGNLLGNASEALTRDLWTNPIAAATDKFFSLFTGKRTKTLAGGRLSGAREGARRGADYLRTGYDIRDMGGDHMSTSKLDVHNRVNYTNKIVDNYVNGVYRWMGAQDQPFYYAAKSAAIHDLAKADGKNLGYKGDKLASYIQDALHNDEWKPQTFKTSKDATEYAKYSVFQNDTMLAHMAGGMKTALGRKNAKWVADFIMPFTQVPSSVAMRVIDRTPVGIAKEIVSQVKNRSFDQRAMAEAIGNGSFGIGVLGAGYALANSGLITGAYPKDSKERKLWQSEGKQEYSVKIGNRWYSLNYMQPFGTILSIGKQVADDKKAGKSDAEAWNSAAATAAQSVGNQSFLQGINGVVSAINDPQRSAGQFTKSLATSAMPNFIRSLASATDSKQRDTKSFGNALKGTVPGLRETLPEKQDMFGASIPSKDNPANMYANPLNPSKVRNTKGLVDELQRLQDSKNGIVTTQFSKNSIGGVKLNDDQVRDLNKKVNSEVYKQWSQAIQSPAYKSLSNEDKATALKRIKDAIGNNVKAQFVKNNKINSTTNYKVRDVPSVSAAASSSSSVSISPKLNESSTKILDHYNSLDSAGRSKWFSTQNDAEYQYYKAKYDNDKANGKISSIQDISRSRALEKDRIGSKYPKIVRDLHGLSKANISDWLSTEEKGVDKQKIAKQLIAYDQSLIDAGLEKYAKIGGGGKGSKGRKKSVLTNSQLISSLSTTNSKSAPHYTAPKFSNASVAPPTMQKVVLTKYTPKKALGANGKRFTVKRGVA